MHSAIKMRISKLRATHGCYEFIGECGVLRLNAKNISTADVEYSLQRTHIEDALGIQWFRLLNMSKKITAREK